MKHIAKKYLGQNFLKNEDVINKIIDCANLKESSSIIEIGCGLGSLTIPILEKTKNFTGIEKDKDLFDILCNQMQNVNFINEDALKFDFTNFSQDSILISNLPYNVGTDIIIKIATKSSINKLIVMLQKEVVDKILSKSQTKFVHPLGIFFNTLANVEHICNVPPSCFTPMPNVMSSVVKITFNECDIDRLNFWNFLKKIFSKRRKMLGKEYGDFAKKRVEELTLDEFMEIFLNFFKKSLIL